MAAAPKGMRVVALAAFMAVGAALSVLAVLSGSSMVFSGAVLAFALAIHQGLWLFGTARASQPADQGHPFGHGREVFFWAYFLAMLLFALGAGLSILHAVFHLMGVGPSKDNGFALADGLGGLLIGLFLLGGSLALALRARAALITAIARPELTAAVEQLVAVDGRIHHVNALIITPLGPDDVLVNLSLDFPQGLTGGEVEAAISDLEADLKARFPEISHLFIEAQSLSAHLKAGNRQGALASERAAS